MKCLAMEHVYRMCIVALTLVVCTPALALEGRRPPSLHDRRRQQPPPEPGDLFNTDTIVARTGRRMRCTVLSIDKEGGVHFTGPWLRGAACADMKRIRRLLFRRADTHTGRDVVVIANGDLIDGEVVEIADKHVTIESELVGDVDVPLGIVERIVLDVAGGAVGWSGLDGGSIGKNFEGWKAISGDWSIVDGRLTCRGKTNGATVALPLLHEGSLTVVFKAVSPESPKVPWGLELFADGLEERVRFDFMRRLRSLGSRVHNMHSKRNPLGPLIIFPKSKGPCKGEFRAAYGAQSRLATCWVNNVLVGRDRNRSERIVREGTHILLTADGAGYIESVRVYRGVVPPGKEDDGNKAEKDMHVFVMLNGSRVKCSQFTLEDEQYLLQVRGEEMPVPADRVRQVILAGNGRARPPVRKGDVRVVAGRSRLTLRITGLKDGKLTGQSEYLGDLKIARALIERIEGNIPVRPKVKVAAPTRGDGQ